GAAAGGPVEAQVVFEVVLLQQVLLEVEDLAVVVAARLHGGLANLLVLGRQLCPAVDHDDPLAGMGEQDLARQGEAGQTGAEDQDVAIVRLHSSSVCAAEALCVFPWTMAAATCWAETITGVIPPPGRVQWPTK